MSEYERKFEAALNELQATEMWASNYAPPVLMVLRKAGIKVPPPHYLGFGKVIVCYGVFFAAAWGVVMWFFKWQAEGFAVSAAIGASVMAGAIFGCAMAAIYARARRRWKLSKWEDL